MWSEGLPCDSPAFNEVLPFYLLEMYLLEMLDMSFTCLTCLPLLVPLLVYSSCPYWQLRRSAQPLCGPPPAPGVRAAHVQISVQKTEPLGQEVFGIGSDTLVRSSQSSSGPWDEELRARTVGVRLPRPGRSESSFRTDPSVCPVMLRHRYRYGTE